MEENTVEIFEYFRVIWKRKILIIVVTLVCMGIGVMNLKLKPKPKLQVAYRAEATVKIGKKMQLESTSSISPRVVYIEDPVMLSRILPIKYDFKFTETLGYHFDIEQVDALAMIKLTLIGPDREVERALKEIVDILIDSHRKKSRSSAVAYESFIKKLKADAKMMQENITIIEASIIKMKKQEERSTEQMETSAGETGGGEDISDLSVVWNMLYLKTIDKEIDLSRSRRDLRDIQWQILVYQTTIGSFEDYNTRMSGKMRFKVVTPKGRDTTNTITVAVVAGLIISLSIAFLMEYIEESKSKLKRKGNGKVDLA